MTGPVPSRPPDEEDPFVVNRVSDAELDVFVPFELEVCEWELDGSADEAGEGWGSAGDYGLE
ncbi:hypothetical protein [Kocuria oceani]|uniref:Uncharacterized protein n=1 Tax=Kocuria oceani TaxID=988827 RepID=A0ABV9TDU9_9MICC|nr:hypothetical protein [Kocuria oceani]